MPEDNFSRRGFSIRSLAFCTDSKWPVQRDRLLKNSSRVLKKKKNDETMITCVALIYSTKEVKEIVFEGL